MYKKVLSLFISMALLLAQENQITVDPQSLANIVLEVNELKNINKKLFREVSLLRERVLGTTQPFSVLQDGQYILPLVICSSTISTEGIIDPLKVNALKKRIVGNLDNVRIVSPEEIGEKHFQTLLYCLTNLLQSSSKQFWFSELSFFLLRRDWDPTLSFNTKLYTINLANQSNFTIAEKNGGNWTSYNRESYTTELNAYDNFQLRKFEIKNACLYKSYLYHKQTQFPYIDLYYDTDKQKKILFQNPFALGGFPLTHLKLHPQSIILLELKKNTTALQNRLSDIPEIVPGPCIVLPKKYEIPSERLICFTLQASGLRLDNVAYPYKFEADGQVIDASKITVYRKLNRFFYRVYIPDNSKIIDISLGYLYHKINCEEMWPGIHFSKPKNINLDKFRQHLEKFKDPHKKHSLLFKYLKRTKLEKKAIFLEEIDEFISYLRTWKSEHQEHINSIIENLIQLK